MLGYKSTGKTSLLEKFVAQEAQNKSEEKVDIHEVTLKTKDQSITILFHDTSGQEPHSLPNQFFKGTSGALIVYDITNRRSFEGIRVIADKFRSESSNADNIVLVGNKADLKD